MSAAVTLKDIAEALDTSIVTVSNALSGKKGVSESVRKSVMDKARELGYNSARYMKSHPEEKGGRGYTLGVVVASGYIEVGGSFYWAMYQRVAYAASRRQSFTMLEVVDREKEQAAELPGLLREGMADGLIVIGKMEEGYIEKLLKTSRVPVVLMDFRFRGAECDTVLSNNYIGMYRMTRYLLQRGHRDIGYIGAIEDNENLCDRYFGYRRGLEEWGIPLRPEWILTDLEPVIFQRQLKLPDPLPTAFVCASDLIASVLYDRLKDAGLKVPEDISVVGYDNYLYGHSFAGELTTYHVDLEEMARIAVKLLLRRIGGNREFCGERYIDSGIIERSSVKDIR